MKNPSFKEMSDEKLLEQQKKISLVTGILAGTLSVLFVLGLFLAFTQKQFSSLLTCLALTPILLLNYSTRNQIKKELDSRKAV